MFLAVVTVDNGGLAPAFAYHKGKFSPKAGIIKSLIIPNGRNTNREIRDLAACLLIWYKRNTTTNSDDAVALAQGKPLQDSPTTDNVNYIHNGSTMTGGSR